MTKLMEIATPDDFIYLGFEVKDDDTGDFRDRFWEMRKDVYCIHIDSYFEVTLHRTDVETSYLTIEITHIQDLKDLIEFISDNNWVEIRTIDDLPKGDGVAVFWTLRKGLNTPMFKVEHFFNDKINEYWLKTYSHYKRIFQPQPILTIE